MARPDDFSIGSLGISNSDFSIGDYSPSTDPILQQQKRIESLKEIADKADIPAELQEPREGLLHKILDTLDTGKQAVLGVIDAAILKGDIYDLAKKNAKGGDPGVGDYFTGAIAAARRGMDTDINSYDILRREGLKSSLARGVVGTAMEIAFDPLTYVSLGGTTLAKFGGYKLSTEGLKLAQELRPVVNEAGLGFGRVAEDSVLHGAFNAAGNYLDAAKAMNRTANPYKKLLLAEDMKKYGEAAKGLLPEGTDIEKLFAKDRIEIAVNLPFLGHFTGRDAATFADADTAGLFSKVAQTVGNVFKSDRVKIGSLPTPTLPDKYAAMFETAKSAATTAASKAIAKVDDVPLVGPAISSVVDGSERLIRGVSEFSKQVFNQRALLGKDIAAARETKINVDAAQRSIVNADVAKLYGDFIFDPKALQEVGVVVDHAGINLLDSTLSAVGKQQELVEKVRRAAMGLENFTDDIATDIEKTVNAVTAAEKLKVQEAYLTKIEGAMNNGAKFPEATRQRLKSQIELFNAAKEGKSEAIAARDRILNQGDFYNDLFVDTLRYIKDNSDISDAAKSMLDRTAGAFDRLFEAERANGIRTSYIEHYVPHLIENLKTSFGEARGGSSRAFLQERKYDTFSDLLLKGGYLGKTNIAEVYRSRALASAKLINEKQYLERLGFHGGANPELLQQVYKSALVDPQAYDALKSRGFNVPEPIDAEKTQRIIEMLGVKKKLAETPSQFFEGLDGIKLNSREQSVMLQAASEIGNQIEAHAQAVGLNSREIAIPLDYFGEAGVKRELYGKEFYLTPTLGKAFDETKQTQDLLRKAVGNSTLGRTLLDWSDAAMDHYRKAVTVFWPAYWTQEAFGNTFFALADQGFEALNPARYMETYGALAGKNGIRLANGKMLSAGEFNDIIKQNGIHFTTNEYLGTVRDFSEANLAKLEKRMATFGQNVKNLQFGAAFEKGIKKFRFGFDNFFRVNQLAHELRKGSSVEDAVKATNDALLNLRDLSPIESSFFRRFYMFYPWIKKSTAKTVNMLLTRPGMISNQIRVARGMAETFTDPSAAPTMDDYDTQLMKNVIGKEQVAFPLGRDKDGNVISGSGFGLPLNTALQQFTLDIPRNGDFSELLDTAGTNVVRNIQKQFAAANPWVKGIFEGLTGKSAFFNKPLSADFLHTVPKLAEDGEKLAQYPYTHIPSRLIDAVTVKFLDGVDNGKGGYVVNPIKFYILSNLIPGLSRIVSTGRRLTDTTLPTTAKLTHTLTGIRVQGNEPELLAGYEQEKSLKDLLDYSSARLKVKADYGNSRK